MIRRVALVLSLVAPSASAEEVTFCWVGNAGYHLEGVMTFPDALSGTERITEADVTSFAITGYLDGAPVGAWSLGALTPQTAWNLNFSPREMRFLTGGYSDNDTGQQWNANGDMVDCGNPGLGFNSGAGAQDLCLDGRFVVESGVLPDTPLVASRAPSSQPCDGSLQLSLAGKVLQAPIP